MEVHMGFVVDKVALEQVLPLVRISLPVIHNSTNTPHTSTAPNVCNMPDLAACYHNLCPQLRLHLIHGTWMEVLKIHTTSV